MDSPVTPAPSVEPLPARTAAGLMPVLFLAHGAPPLLDDRGWVEELARWGGALPKPKAILMVSAHWEQRPLAVGATHTVPLVYDFYGFPQRYYQQSYPAPGAPALASRLEAMMGSQTPLQRTDRGLDHGAYVPLVAMYPNAEIPVLQLSMPSLAPQALFALGESLAALREEGVLIVGSGFLTHNLRRGMGQRPESWALDFDAWVQSALERGEVDTVLNAAERAPAFSVNHPTTEHWAPLLLSLGAASHTGVVPKTVIDGFWFGSFSRRSVQWG